MTLPMPWHVLCFKILTRKISAPRRKSHAACQSDRRESSRHPERRQQRKARFELDELESERMGSQSNSARRARAWTGGHQPRRELRQCARRRLDLREHGAAWLRDPRRYAVARLL